MTTARAHAPRGARDPIAARVLALARPAIAQSLLQTLTFLVDRAMLGRHGAESLAALQVGEATTWCLFLVTSGFTAGSVALVGRAVGGEDAALRRAAVRATVALALTAGLVAAALGAGVALAAPALFPNAGPDVLARALGYLAVALPGQPLLLLAMGLAATFHASGDTRTPFAAAALGNVLNAAAGFVLIFGRFGAPELGATGAAVGSVASWGAQCAWLGTALLARDPELLPRSARGRLRAALAALRSRRRALAAELDAARRILRVALPAMGERALQAGGYLGWVAMIASLGPAAMAAHQALLGVEAIAFLSADGFGVAGAAVCAQRLGARAPDEARRAGRVAVALAVTLLAAVAMAFLAAPAALIGAFTDDAALVALGAPALRVAALAQPFMAVAVVLADTLRGAGATRAVLGVTLAGGVLVRLTTTAVCVFALDLGLVGVWIGSTADWAVRALALSLLFRGDRWTRAAV